MQEYPKWEQTGVNEATGEPVGRVIDSPAEEVIQPKVAAPKPQRPEPAKSEMTKGK